MINILLWILFGALVGWVASLIMDTDKEQGAVLNVVVGVVGALIGGFIMNVFGAQDITGFNWYTFFVSLLGAVVLLGIVKLVRGSGNERRLRAR